MLTTTHPAGRPSSRAQIEACAVDGCERPSAIRGWCTAHYSRWLRKGDPGPAEVQPRGRTGCQTPGCEEPHYRVGFCSKHVPKRRLKAPCRVPGCDEVFAGGWGFCRNHYERWRLTGKLDNVRRGSAHHMWAGDQVTYTGAHDRVRSVRGPASALPCSTCGAEAKNWAYVHDAADEHVDERGRRYSTNPDDYQPMCLPCHRQFDHAHRKVLTG